MAFQYYGQGGYPQQGYKDENPFATTSQQPAGGGMPQMPMGLMGMMGGEGGMGGMFGGGGAAVTGGGGGGSAAAGGAGSAASGAGSSMAGGLSAAGPWALLAAVIIANESEAKKAGRRSEDHGEHAQDMITGKVLEQDMDYYGDKVGGVGGEMLKGMGKLGNPEGVFNILKKGSLLRKIF